MFWCFDVGWPLLRAEGFFCNLDVLYGGQGIGKLQFLIKKIFFFSAVNFFNFWSIKPCIRIGSGSGLVLSLKCWIRIRMKWMRIRNPAWKDPLAASFSLAKFRVRSSFSWRAATSLNKYEFVEDRCCKYKYIHRSTCFTIMAPERQFICVSYVEISTNTFGPKMCQFF